MQKSVLLLLYLILFQVPLTYFAKGSLSRARACFHSNDGSATDCSHLIDHLRSLILSVQMLDKKYRDTVPNLIKDLPFSLGSGDDGASILASMKRTRKSKSIISKKNALYPNEEIDLTKWWLGKDVSRIVSDTENAREECTRNLLLDQRSRETQLQIIIILETLALGASMPNVESKPRDGFNQPTLAENDAEKARKPKKPQDLDTLLDLFVDRLSIWQTMVSEDSKHSKGKENSAPHTDQSTKSRNRSNLPNQFCVDVVIPL